MNYELHPLCALFPRLSKRDFSALVDDIRANGLQNPIQLYDGMILDGGNRYSACLAAGVEPEFVEFAGDSALAYVLSANLHRRHLSLGQQAAIVASAQDWALAQTVGNPTFKKSGNVTGLARVADRAALSGASDKTQRDADKVAKADPALAVQVAHGELSLQQAVAKVTRKPRKPHKPKSMPDQSVPPEYADCGDGAEVAASITAEEADRRVLDLLLSADDKLAAAIIEIRRLNAELVVAKLQRNMYQNQAAEFALQIKRLKEIG